MRSENARHAAVFQKSLIKTRQSLAVEPPTPLRGRHLQGGSAASAVCKTTMRRSRAQCPSLEGKHPLAQMIFLSPKPEKITSKSVLCPPDTAPWPLSSVLKLRPSPPPPPTAPDRPLIMRFAGSPTPGPALTLLRRFSLAGKVCLRCRESSAALDFPRGDSQGELAFYGDGFSPARTPEG